MTSCMKTMNSPLCCMNKDTATAGTKGASSCAAPLSIFLGTRPRKVTANTCGSSSSCSSRSAWTRGPVAHYRYLECGFAKSTMASERLSGDGK